VNGSGPDLRVTSMTVTRLILLNQLWTPLVALAIALPMVFAGIDRLVTASAVAGGAVVTGTVTDLDRGSDSMRVSTPVVGVRQWTVDYRFQTASGETFEGQAAIPQALFETLSEGGPIELRHAAADPARSDPLGSNTRRDGILFTGFSIVLFGAGAAILLIFGPRAASMWRASRSGPPRLATVTALEPRYPALPDHPERRVRWRDTATGAAGEADRWRRKDLPAIGDAIPVRLDPRNGRAWWEADL
jgi:hypothetical protein